jgi:hypothetical protein
MLKSNNLCNYFWESLPTGPLPTGRQAVPTVGGAGGVLSRERKAVFQCSLKKE